MLKQKPGDKPDNLIKNLREPAPKKAKVRRERRFLRWRYILPTVLVVLILLGIYGFFTAKTVLNHVNSGVDHIQSAVDMVKDDSTSFNLATLDKLTAQLSAAQDDFQQARDASGPVSVVLPLVGWLPGPAYDLSQLPAFLEIAEKTSQSGVLVLQGARPALAPFDSSQTNSSSGPAGATASGKLTQAANALAQPDAQARFAQALSLMNDVGVRRAELDPAKLKLSQTKKAVEQLDEQLPALRDGLQLARDLPPLLPSVLGTTRPVSYLTLIENSDELRATGGFLSAIGLITLDNGKLSLSNFSDSYAVDNPAVTPETPPAPLARYMQAGYFLLRDANWWPDFPTSARKIAGIYQQDTGTTVDNVLALDSKTVGYLFDALGPLDLPSYNEHLTADNFEERLRYYYLPPDAATNDDWWLKRKAFIGVVMQGLLGKLNGASARDYIKVASALGQAATEKHLQLYSANGDLETQLAKRNLTGAQTPPAAPVTNGIYNDYLMMVDTNLSFNKASPNISRTASYKITSGGAGATLFASLTLTYTSKAGVREGTNPGECVKVAKYDSTYESMMNGCYWNYLRIYVPSGSRLTDSTGFPSDDPLTTNQEDGMTYFASQIVIPPGNTLTVTLNYVLPGTLPPNALYRLAVQQQAGALPTPLSINLTWPEVNRQWSAQLDRDMVFNQP